MSTDEHDCAVNGNKQKKLDCKDVYEITTMAAKKVVQTFPLAVPPDFCDDYFELAAQTIVLLY